MFKSNFERICLSRKLSPSKVVRAIGVNPSSYSRWDENSIPRRTTLVKLADYLNCTVDDLLRDDTKIVQNDQPNAEIAQNEHDELNEYLEALKNRSDLRILFSLAKGASKADVMRAVAIIEALRLNETQDDN